MGKKYLEFLLGKIIVELFWRQNEKNDILVYDADK